jgi:hypothetical protein
MRSLLAALALAALSAAVQAEVYKWVDKDGNVHYGDTPPPNVRPKPVNVVPSVSAPAKAGEPAQVEQKPAAAAPAVPPIQVTVNPPAPEPQPPAAVRGMPFDVFILLRQGMSEAELLQRAGPPDYMSVDGSVGSSVISGRRVGPPGPDKPPRVQTFSNLELKNFYYYPTVSDPFTTVVTLTGGRISEMQRTRKF